MKHFYHLFASLTAVMALTIGSAPCAMAAEPGNDAAASRSDEIANFEQYEMEIEELNFCSDYLNALCMVLQNTRIEYSAVMAGDIDDYAASIEVQLSEVMQVVNMIYDQIFSAYDAALESGTYDSGDATEQIQNVENVLNALDISVMELSLQCQNAMVMLEDLNATTQNCNAVCQDLENRVLAEYENYDTQFLSQIVDDLTNVEAQIANVWAILSDTPISIETMEEVQAELQAIMNQLAEIQSVLDNYSGITDAAVDAIDATYYDLSGRRVAKPEKGRIYIQCQGSATSTVRY